MLAHLQPPQLKALVDGSLVFGVPLVGFTLQSALVGDFEYGQALSALAITAVYIIFAKVLWNKQREGTRLLTESYLAQGVIFASFAIPFALDGIGQPHRGRLKVQASPEWGSDKNDYYHVCLDCCCKWETQWHFSLAQWVPILSFLY